MEFEHARQEATEAEAETETEAGVLMPLTQEHVEDMLGYKRGALDETRLAQPARDSYRVMPAGKARARVEREMQREPTQDEERQILQRHAWRYHRRCGGKGYRMRNGEIEGCSCAEKRMRRYLSKRGAL